MPSIGLIEIIFLMVIVVGVGGVVAVFAAGRRGRNSPVLPVGSPDLQARVQEFVARGQPIQAVTLLRRETGMRLVDAKRIVDQMAAGRPLPAAFTGRASGALDVADRARELKFSDRAEQAVFLVRGETGMSHAEAVAFVDALEARDIP